MPNHVLQIDCSGGITGLEAELDLAPYSGPYSTVWVEADFAFNSAYLTALLTGVDADELVRLSDVFGSTGSEEIQVDPTGTGGWTTAGRSGATFGGAPSGGVLAASLAPLQFYRLKLRVTAGTPATADAWIDGTSLGPITMTGIDIGSLVFLDIQAGIVATPGALAYFDNVIVGTTEGTSDILSDDFEGVGAPSASIWNSFIDATVIDDPGISPPAAPPPPPDTSILVVRLYDLGTTMLADISDIAFEVDWSPRFNLIDQCVVTAPAGHTLLTTVAGDGYPNLRKGNRKLVVWEDADPDTEDPIFHGRVVLVERSGNGDENLVTITAANPVWELGYESGDRAGRVVRGSTNQPTSGDPFGEFDGNLISPLFASSVGGQDEISGPDLILQVLTNTQDPGYEGPLPIDLQSGTFDLDCPPAVDLSCVDNADWPVMVGDFINQIIQTNVVDIYLQPVRPGTGLNLDGDPDDYIMGALTAVSSFGDDKSGTVHYDYWTGSHNAKEFRHADDFATILNKLTMELGPRLNKTHWRGNITGLFVGAVSGAASAALYGGPPGAADPGYFFQLVVYDSLGTENSSRPLYDALWNAEMLLRREPRQMLYITPAGGSKALFMPPVDFHVGDLIAVNLGAETGLELADVQRVYGYDKHWNRERVPSITNLITSADAE